MRFLADECLHVGIVVALRDAGHEVTTIAPSETGATDEVVLERASRERAILLTADKVSARSHTRALPPRRASCFFAGRSRTRQLQPPACSR